MVCLKLAIFHLISKKANLQYFGFQPVILVGKTFI